MNKALKYTLIALAVLGLVAIRMFEDRLFYDPLLDFFKGQYQGQTFPALDSGSLFWNTAFRFLLNSLLSLGIIHWVFGNKKTTLLAAFLYLLVFFVLGLLFWWQLSSQTTAFNALFYVRRILIQPILLLLLLPAFYYHKRMQ